MAEVLLFHHVLGLTPGVRAFAGRLEAAGHTVHAPDLLDGRTFATIEAGVRHVAEGEGFAAVAERGARAADGLPDAIVPVGFSLGVLPAQRLAQTRPGARAAVLCAGCVPAAEFGAPWPAGVPVQVHAMDGDPIFRDEGDLAAARALVAAADDGELFLYPGDAHLFFDPGTAGHDAAATGLMTERILALLAGV